jgi:hypothetical protein
MHDQVGAPFSGKTHVARALAAAHNLRLLEPEAQLAAATRAAREWREQRSGDGAPGSSAAQQHGAGSDSSPGDGGAAADGPTAAVATTGGDQGATLAPGPSRLAVLGEQVGAALLAGAEVGDALLVDVMVASIEETVGWVPPPGSVASLPAPVNDPAAVASRNSATGGGKKGGGALPKADAAGGAPPPPPEEPVLGFVLDGFPRTAAQVGGRVGGPLHSPAAHALAGQLTPL